MILKNNKTIVLFFLVSCMLLGYWLWLSLRSVEIIAIHQKFDTTSVLVNHFPLTDKGKVNWWLKNKDMLKAKYDIPKPSSSGYFTIIFWNFGDGYKKEEKYDRLCFDDMKGKVNCIEKDAVFAVDKNRNWGVTFNVYDGDNYRLGQSGDIIKIE